MSLEVTFARSDAKPECPELNKKANLRKNQWQRRP